MEPMKVSNLINKVIDNELKHIREDREGFFLQHNKEQRTLTEISENTYKKLRDSIPEEYRDDLDTYYTSVCDEWVNLCDFYFKEGVTSGLTNLSFLKDFSNYIYPNN